MKNLAITSIVLLALSMGSCKKEYVCDCNKIRSNNGNSVSTNDGEYSFNDTQARAESRCNDQETTGSDSFGSYTRECNIR